MLKHRILFLVFILGLFSSCEKNANNATNSNSILGCWINPSYNDSIVTFEKSDNLEINDYGIEFKEKGLFIERNSGWCGTPPLTYSNCNGTWHIKGSLIQISVDFWGIQNEYKWKLISVNNEKLTIIKQLEEYN